MLISSKVLRGGYNAAAVPKPNNALATAMKIAVGVEKDFAGPRRSGTGVSTVLRNLTAEVVPHVTCPTAKKSYLALLVLHFVLLVINPDPPRTRFTELVTTCESAKDDRRKSIAN